MLHFITNLKNGTRYHARDLYYHNKKIEIYHEADLSRPCIFLIDLYQQSRKKLLNLQVQKN